MYLRELVALAVGEPGTIHSDYVVFAPRQLDDPLPITDVVYKQRLAHSALKTVSSMVVRIEQNELCVFRR